jgi:CubicO group peptidase (beta-lactamase class C family)
MAGRPSGFWYFRAVRSFDGLRRTCHEAVKQGVTPGLVVVVGVEGRNVFHDAFGHRQIDPHPLPATPDTIYDLASLTKPLATTLVAMRAAAEGRIDIFDDLLPDEPEGPSIRQALAHAGGFVAHRPFYERVVTQDVTERRRNVVQLAAAEPRAYQPGEKSLYSDLGFIVLGDRLEKALGHRLDVLAAEAFAPLKLPTLRFGVEGKDRPVAPTQRSAERGLVQGKVDDLNAWAMEGIAGHAGLFGDAADVAAVAHALCAAWRDDSSPLVSGSVVRHFWQPAAVPGSNWRLGWDGPAATNSLAGALISREAVGHLGFTGCSLWIDPERATFVLVLANRVHPTAKDDPRWKALRPALNDAALEDAGYRS